MELEDIKLKDLIEKETGEKFNKNGFIKCCFHQDKTPSLSVKYNANDNKERFKCFSCDSSGDAIDFISKLKGINYKESRKYLNIEEEKTQRELDYEKIVSYIEWQIKNVDFRKNNKLIGLFEFTNADNSVVYYKAKFLDSKGNKNISYYHTKEGKIINKRGTDEEIIYNFYNTVKAAEDGKIIIFTEGEKDANLLNKLLNNNRYCVTSAKGCKNLNILKQHNIKAWICGDTGAAGEKYKNFIKYELIHDAKEIRIINLPGIGVLGENKDVTDWINTGKNIDDFLMACNRSLDIKAKFELQQDKFGIYKIMYDKKEENYKKVYLTNFTLIEAKRVNFVDKEKECIKLKFKSITGQTIERIGESTVFNDIRAFRNFLGTLDLTVTGRTDDIVTLGAWINKYFALENEEVHSGIKFIENNGQIELITPEGTISKDGIDIYKKCENSKLNFIDVDLATKEDLEDIKNNIFDFSTMDVMVPILGNTVNVMTTFHNESIHEKINLFLLVGESGSGKSTIVENIIAPILNIPKEEIRAIAATSGAGLEVTLSLNNYPVIFEEWKPSTWDKYKVSKISDILNNLYDRHTITKSNKEFTQRNLRLMAPIILAGEESFPNNDQSKLERSAIVYLGKANRTNKSNKCVEWLKNNQDKLNRMGRSIIQYILEMPIEEYKIIYDTCREQLKGKLNYRVLATGTNIAVGIEIWNMILIKNGIEEIKGYEKYIIQNLRDEILEGGSNTKSIVERMIILYNELISDGRANKNLAIKEANNKIYIRSEEIVNQIYVYIKETNAADLIPIKVKEFKKQAKKAEYIIGSKTMYDSNLMKNVRYDEFDKNKLADLDIPNIAEKVLYDFDEYRQVDFRDGEVPF